MRTKDLTKTINKEQYIEYRETHTQKETQKQFNITRKNVLYLDDLFELDKEKLKAVAQGIKAKKYSRWWYSLSEEERLKYNAENSTRVKKYHQDHPEFAKQHSERQLAYYSDEANRKQHSETMLTYFRENPDKVEKMKAGLVNYYKEHPEACEECSRRSKEWFSVEANKKKLSKSLKAYHRNNPNAYAKQVKAQETFWNSERGSEVKQHLSKKAIDRWDNNEEYRNAVIEGHQEYWQSEEFRQRCAENGRKVWDIPEEERRKKFASFGRVGSVPNKNFAELLDKNNINYESEFYIDHYIYDFKVDNNLIEINPFPFHNVTFSPFGDPKGETYHYDKTLTAIENGYRCIHVWDWDDVNRIIELLKPREKLYARKCIIKEVQKDEAVSFIDNFHIQGSTKTDRSKDTIRLGLYFEDKLVSIITFGKPRYNKNYEYELIRYCSSHNIIGGAEKLFKNFIKTYKPNSVISYCDFSKFTGMTYEKLGFTQENLRISSHWYHPKTKKHITDNLLRRYGADKLIGTNYGKGTNNKEILIENGFFEIKDSGQITYSYHHESGTNK